MSNQLGFSFLLAIKPPYVFSLYQLFVFVNTLTRKQINKDTALTKKGQKLINSDNYFNKLQHLIFCQKQKQFFVVLKVLYLLRDFPFSK